MSNKDIACYEKQWRYYHEEYETSVPKSRVETFQKDAKVPTGTHFLNHGFHVVHLFPIGGWIHHAVGVCDVYEDHYNQGDQVQILAHKRVEFRIQVVVDSESKFEDVSECGIARVESGPG